MITPWGKVMNEITSTELEVEITFGNVEQLFLRHIYNLRVMYPNLEILLPRPISRLAFASREYAQT